MPGPPTVSRIAPSRALNISDSQLLKQNATTSPPEPSRFVLNRAALITRTPGMFVSSASPLQSFPLSLFGRQTRFSRAFDMPCIDTSSSESRSSNFFKLSDCNWKQIDTKRIELLKIKVSRQGTFVYIYIYNILCIFKIIALINKYVVWKSINITKRKRNKNIFISTKKFGNLSHAGEKKRVQTQKKKKLQARG